MMSTPTNTNKMAGGFWPALTRINRSPDGEGSAPAGDDGAGDTDTIVEDEPAPAPKPAPVKSREEQAIEDLEIEDPMYGTEKAKTDEDEDEEPAAAPKKKAAPGKKDSKSEELEEGEEEEQEEATPELVQRAKNAGFDDEDVDSFKTPALLERAVSKREAAALAAGGRGKQNGESDAAEETEVEHDEEGLDGITLGDDIDPEIRGAFDKVKKVFAPFMPLLKELPQVLQHIAEVKTDAHLDEMTTMFRGVPAEYKHLFDVPEGARINETKGDTRKRIMSMIDKMQTLEIAHLASGKKVNAGVRKQLFSDALALLHRGDAKKIARKEITEQLKKRQGATFVRSATKKPTQRLNRTQTAIQNVARKMREMNVSYDEDERPEEFN